MEETLILRTAPINLKDQLHHIFNNKNMIFCLVCKECIYDNANLIIGNHLVLHHIGNMRHQENIKSLFQMCIQDSFCDESNEIYMDIITKSVFDVAVLLGKEKSYICTKGEHIVCLICGINISKSAFTREMVNNEITEHLLSEDHKKSIKDVCWLYRLSSGDEFLLFQKFVVYCSICKRTYESKENVLLTAVCHLQSKIHSRTHNFDQNNVSDNRLNSEHSFKFSKVNMNCSSGEDKETITTLSQNITLTSDKETRNNNKSNIINKLLHKSEQSFMTDKVNINCSSDTKTAFHENQRKSLNIVKELTNNKNSSSDMLQHLSKHSFINDKDNSTVNYTKFSHHNQHESSKSDIEISNNSDNKVIINFGADYESVIPQNQQKSSNMSKEITNDEKNDSTDEMLHSSDHSFMTGIKNVNYGSEHEERKYTTFSQNQIKSSDIDIEITTNDEINVKEKMLNSSEHSVVSSEMDFNRTSEREDHKWTKFPQIQHKSPNNYVVRINNDENNVTDKALHFSEHSFITGKVHVKCTSDLVDHKSTIFPQIPHKSPNNDVQMSNSNENNFIDKVLLAQQSFMTDKVSVNYSWNYEENKCTFSQNLCKSSVSDNEQNIIQSRIRHSKLNKAKVKNSFINKNLQFIEYVSATNKSCVCRLCGVNVSFSTNHEVSMKNCVAHFKSWRHKKALTLCNHKRWKKVKIMVLDRELNNDLKLKEFQNILKNELKKRKLAKKKFSRLRKKQKNKKSRKTSAYYHYYDSEKRIN